MLLSHIGREATGGSFSNGPLKWAGESAQGQLMWSVTLDIPFCCGKHRISAFEL